MNKIHLLSDDQNLFGGITSYNDKLLLSTVPGDTGLVQITSEEQLKELILLAKKRFDEFDKIIRPIINKKRAIHAKNLYLVEKYSWRALSVRCWTEWNGTWQPPDNQLAGMKICEIAEGILKIKINPPPAALDTLLGIKKS